MKNKIKKLKEWVCFLFGHKWVSHPSSDYYSYLRCNMKISFYESLKFNIFFANGNQRKQTLINKIRG